MPQAKCLDHVLILTVESKFILDVPTPSKLCDFAHALGESQNCLIGGIAVDDSLVKGKTHGRRIEVSSIAEPGNGSELAEGVVGGVCIILKYHGGASFVRSHSLLADGAFGDNHFVLQWLASSSRREKTAHQLTCVSVPVLSEQMTETDPSVSTVLSDLQRIFCLRIMLALMVMLAVSATGKPSGIKATATETQDMMRLGTLIQPGWSFRNHVALLEG